MNNTIIVNSETIESRMAEKKTGFATIDKPWQKFYRKEVMEREIPKLTAYQFLVNQNQDNLNTVAIEYYGRKIRFKNLIEKIDEAAEKLHNIGIDKGG